MAQKKSKKAKRQAMQLLGLSLVAWVVMYVFASWAIDSGSIITYILSFVALYYALRYLKAFIKEQFSR